MRPVNLSFAGHPVRPPNRYNHNALYMTQQGEGEFVQKSAEEQRNEIVETLREHAETDNINGQRDQVFEEIADRFEKLELKTTPGEETT